MCMYLSLSFGGGEQWLDGTGVRWCGCTVLNTAMSVQ